MTKLTDLQLINGRLVFDAVSGKFYRISDSACFLIEVLKRKLALDDIIVAYAGRYKITQQTAQRDIEAFLNDLGVMR